jgi:hypothetical protein
MVDGAVGLASASRRGEDSRFVGVEGRAAFNDLHRDNLWAVGSQDLLRVGDHSGLVVCSRRSEE